PPRAARSACADPTPPSTRRDGTSRPTTVSPDAGLSPAASRGLRQPRVDDLERLEHHLEVVVDRRARARQDATEVLQVLAPPAGQGAVVLPLARREVLVDVAEPGAAHLGGAEERAGVPGAVQHDREVAHAR